MHKHKHGIEYDKSVELAQGMLNNLTHDELELIKNAIDGYQEKSIVKIAYQMSIGDWDGDDGDNDWVIPSEDVLFVITDDDAQNAAHAMIGRDLTADEIQIAREGIEAGLGNWLFVVRLAVREAVSA